MFTLRKVVGEVFIRVLREKTTRSANESGADANHIDPRLNDTHSLPSISGISEFFYIIMLKI